MKSNPNKEVPNAKGRRSLLQQPKEALHFSSAFDKEGGGDHHELNKLVKYLRTGQTRPVSNLATLLSKYYEYRGLQIKETFKDLALANLEKKHQSSQREAEIMSSQHVETVVGQFLHFEHPTLGKSLLDTTAKIIHSAHPDHMCEHAHEIHQEHPVEHVDHVENIANYSVCHGCHPEHDHP